MTSRLPAPPPRIPGFTFIKSLGQGGFADVYLYQQDSPRRVVAVKVLIAEMAGTEAAARLRREADAMAGLSQHQNIVTVFQSGTAADGRAFMVMEYYPRAALSQGLKTSQRSLASVLSIGIQLAGAVESAHRLGIMHRDIKPANILVDRAGRPVLGDFGIAMTDAEAAKGGAQGMSIPYSPPEAFDVDPHPLPQSDVWSLAATIYALLTGRAPFEIPGGDNRPHIMIDRIRSAPYTPVGRQDMPASLDQVLATAMSKSPTARYATMQAFGRALGEIEQELHLSSTPMDLIDTSSGFEYAQDNGELSGTQLRPIALIDPSGPSVTRPPTVTVTQPMTGSTTPVTTGSGPSITRASTTQPPWQSVVAPYAGPRDPFAPPVPGEETADHTRIFGEIALEPVDQVDDVEPAPPKPKGSPLRAIIVGLVVLAIAAVVGVVIWSSGGRAPDTPLPPTETSHSVVPQDPLGQDGPSAPVDLVGTLSADGQTATFTWTNPSPQPGDTYRWSVVGDPNAKATAVPDTTVKDVAVPQGQGTVCIAVRVVRAGKGSEAASACAK